MIQASDLKSRLADRAHEVAQIQKANVSAPVQAARKNETPDERKWRKDSEDRSVKELRSIKSQVESVDRAREAHEKRKSPLATPMDPFRR